MKRFFLILPSIAVLSTSSLAFAGIPMLNPSCASSVNIQGVENGSGVYFSEDCKTAYVLPPAKASASLDGISANASLDLCAPFDTAKAMITDSYKMAEDILKELHGANKKTKAPTNPLGPNRGLGGGGNQPSGTVASAEDRQAIIQRYQQALTIAKESNSLLDPFKNIEGGTAQIIFEANWDKVINAYKAANPGIHFERLQMSNQVLSYVRKTSSDMLQIPAAFSVKIPGVSNIIAADGSAANENTGLIFGEALSGQIVLTLAGSCPLYNTTSRKIKSSISASELASLFSANVQFEFNLRARRKYQASYNLAQLLKRIQESGKKGGFFSSSSYSNLLIEKSSNDWFTFSSEDEDPRHAYDLDSLRATVKADLVNRVVRSMTALNGGDPSSIPAPGAPGPHGATVASDALKKCPNMYCQVGAAVLDILDATFGSSSSSSTYINNNNYWAKDDVNEVKTLSYTGSYSFTGGQ